MLTISRALHDKIVAHARSDHPDEACGIVAGPAGTGRPERFIPMMNVERSPTFYRFDSMEQFRVWKEMEERDEEPVIIYHSHTATDPYPSRTDISYATEPAAHYVLVATRDPEIAEFRSFRIVDGEVTEEEVRVVPDASPSAGHEMPVQSALPGSAGSPLPGESGKPAASGAHLTQDLTQTEPKANLRQIQPRTQATQTGLRPHKADGPGGRHSADGGTVGHR